MSVSWIGTLRGAGALTGKPPDLLWQSSRYFLNACIYCCNDRLLRCSYLPFRAALDWSSSNWCVLDLVSVLFCCHRFVMCYK